MLNESVIKLWDIFNICWINLFCILFPCSGRHFFPSSLVQLIYYRFIQKNAWWDFSCSLCYIYNFYGNIFSCTCQKKFQEKVIWHIMVGCVHSHILSSMRSWIWTLQSQIARGLILFLYWAVIWWFINFWFFDLEQLSFNIHISLTEFGNVTSPSSLDD